MILDNEKHLKVYEWITKYTEEGTVDIVTGYFTVGALAYLSQQINYKIAKFRLVLGDIVNLDKAENRPLDLLNENITIEAALNLSRLAQEAVIFLRQDKVKAKTLEPNFCHAKCYLFEPSKNDDRNKYFISGSSNLTEAGIGLKQTNNLELNIAETGNNSQYKELVEWFETLWHKPQAHKEKTILAKDGTSKKIDFKQYLIEAIAKIFIEYSPRDIYYKILFELFGNQILEIENDPEFNRQVGRLENTAVFNALYDFQKKGVLSLIRMLQKYDGAILADAVGLGKTWSALAVMKFFQMQGREVILLCPKKLESNWRRYKEDQESKFEVDKLKFFIRFHTDMNGVRLDSYNDRADKLFGDDKPKLIIIDESHNLRNDKSSRYKFLVDRILKNNQDVKVLLISATPINNSLNDVRNQFKLMVQGDVHGYEAKLGVKNLDYSFKQAQTEFNEWRKAPNPKIGDFIRKLSGNDFFRLTDSLLVARTRKMVESQQTDLVFPIKTKPKNLFVTPHQLGNFETFEELFDHFPPMLSGYQPAFYLDDEKAGKKDTKRDILTDEKLRDRFLVKMIYILMVKRLESSWFSFYSTVEKIKDHHQNALDKIKEYQTSKAKDIVLENDAENLDDDENDDEFVVEAVEQYTLGKKRKISIVNIDSAGKLDRFKEDLKQDLDALDNLYVNLQKFKEKVAEELGNPKQLKSCDEKLEKLIEEIIKKRKSGKNNDNQKVVIFTVYRDTAMYLYDQLRDRGFDKIAIASGTGSLSDDSDRHQKMEAILERFAPYTKLFCEKEWIFQSEKVGLEAFTEWQNWIKEKHPETHQKLTKPIDILIATDALSEGQNLQDADMVINYDIHWNPVRIIQRMGRIDRLGSPNQEIFGINFWPSANIDSYLNLQGRIEQRMAVMKLAGAEVDHQFSDSFAKMIHDEDFDRKMSDRMMKQMEITWDDIEVGDDSLRFDSLSLERYRQDLLAEFNRDKDKYRQMPKGVYSGFMGDADNCHNGIVALLGYPAKPAKKVDHQYQVFELIYIDKSGKLVLENQKEVLDFLTLHKDNERFVPDAVDRGEPGAIAELVNALKSWLNSQAVTTEVMEDGSVKETMGKGKSALFAGLKRGDKAALETIKQNVKIDDKYKLNNFDLVAWLLVSENRLF